jgi:hypothetical protein
MDFDRTVVKAVLQVFDAFKVLIYLDFLPCARAPQGR